MAIGSAPATVPHSLMSAPTQKARLPAPVISTTRTSGAASSVATSSSSRSSIAMRMALCFSGRFRVIVAMPSSTWYKTSEALTPHLLPGPAAPGPCDSGRNRRASISCKAGLTRNGTSAWLSTSRSRSTPGAISTTVNPTGSKPDHAALSHVQHVLAVLLRAAPAEGHVLDIRRKFAHLALLDDAQATILDLEVQAAGREVTAKDDGARMGSYVDEAAHPGGHVRSGRQP